MRPDLTITQSVERGETHWLVKDSVSLQYFRLQPRQYLVLSLLDGRRSLEEIRERLQREFRDFRPSLSEIQQFIGDLHQKGLVVSRKIGQAAILLRRRQKRIRRQALAALTNVFYIRLPGWDPHTLLDCLYPWTRWLFHPLSLLLAFAVVLFAWGLLIVRFDAFQQQLPAFHAFFGPSNMLLLWATMGAAKVIHELGHALACRHHNAECHEIGVAFLVFSPCLYCDVSDTWMVPNKWKRIAVSSAGVAIELVISAVALLAWWHMHPGLLKHLCLNLFFVSSTATVLCNANPFLRYDGYYVLCDLLEIPNLRMKADRLLARFLGRICLGLPHRPDPFLPTRGTQWLMAYSVAAACYRWVLFFAVAIFLYRVLKPYGLESLGLFLFVVSAGVTLGRSAVNAARFVREGKAKEIRPRRVLATTIVLAAIAAAALLVPLPSRVEAPLVIEPRGVQHVYAPAAGRLTEVCVKPGQLVQKGTVLARLSNFVKQDRREQLANARRVQEIEVAMQRLLGDPAQEKLAAETLAELDAEIREYESQLNDLVLVAPCSGRVLPAPGVPRAARDRLENRLPRMTGHPIDDKNLGCWIATGTHLLSIAPDDRCLAVLLVPQHGRNDLHEDQQVAVKLDHRPGAVYHGTIASLASRDGAIAPKQLSNKFGGPLATMTDSQGRERLANTSYEAAVELDSPADPLIPGARGRARIVVAKRTAAEILWRYACQTLHFRL